MSSWKTTLAGIFAAIGSAMAASSDPTLHAVGQIALAIGVLAGLGAARDNDVSSETAHAK